MPPSPILEGQDRPGAGRSAQSHGGSGKQARAVIDGLQADVVTLALADDIDEIAARGLLAARLAEPPAAQHAPYTSTIVFLVRQGQSQGHPRLGRPGEARHRRHHAEPEDLRRRPLGLPGGLGLGAAASPAATTATARGISSAALYKNVPVLDTGARGSTTTFAQRGHRRRAAVLGERGATWRWTSSAPKFDIVYPSLSHPGRAAGGPGGQERRPPQDPRRWRRPI